MSTTGTSAITGTITTTAGIAVLPNTSGNMVAHILAATAIGVGVITLISQIIVHVVRRKYGSTNHQ